MTKNEMVGCHCQLNGLVFEQAPGIDDGQGSLACCGPWGRKESDMTELTDSTSTMVFPGGSDGKESASSLL